MPKQNNYSDTPPLISRLKTKNNVDTQWFNDFSTLFTKPTATDELANITAFFTQRLEADQNFPDCIESKNTAKAYDLALEAFARKWEKLYLNTQQYQNEFFRMIPFLFLSEDPPGVVSEVEKLLRKHQNKSRKPNQKLRLSQILLLIKAIQGDRQRFVETYVSIKNKLPWEFAFQHFLNAYHTLFAFSFKWEPNSELVEIEKNFLINLLRDKVLSAENSANQRKIIRATQPFYQRINRSKEFANRLISELKSLFHEAHERNELETAMELYRPLQYIFSSSLPETEQKKFDKDVTSKHSRLMEKSINPIVHDLSDLNPPYNVGYFIYQTNFFPPARGRTALLRGHHQLDSEKFNFFFYNTGAYRMHSEEFETFIRNELPDVKFRTWQDYFDEAATLGEQVSQMEVAENLVSQVREDDLDIAIYAKEDMCGYLAIARAAPVQIFHSHGATEFPYNHIDGYQNYFNSMKEWDKYDNVNFFRYPMLEEFVYPEKNEELYRDLKNRFREFDFLYGSLDRLKKLEDHRFLRAIETILQQNPGSAYIFAGKGDATDILAYFKENNLEDRVFYEGYTNSPRSHQRLLDVCLAPFPEFGGRAQIEFMANKTPVVSLSFENSDNPELANYPRTEMVKEIYGIEGLYVDNGNIDKYIEFATRLNRDNAFYENSCTRAYQTYQKRFDLKKAAQKCEDFYLKLIEQKRSNS